MENRSDRFTAIEDQYAGYEVYDPNGEKIGKGPVAVATHQLRPAAHVFLPPEALVAGPAEHVGVDHDPGSGSMLQRRALKGTNHLVSEDQGIVDGYLAAEDADIGTADTSGPDAHHNIFSTCRRFGALLKAQVLRCFEDYGGHTNHSP